MNSTETLRLTDGYSRLKNPPAEEYRLMTFAEAAALTYGTALFTPDFKVVRRVSINGRPKTWKRDPERLEVGCKYGMYEHGRAEWRDGAMRFPNGGALVVKL